MTLNARTITYAMAALTLVMLSAVIKSANQSNHQNGIKSGKTQAKTSDREDDEDDLFWNLSSLSVKDRKEFMKVTITMTELWANRKLRTRDDIHSKLLWHEQKKKARSNRRQRRLKSTPSSKQGRSSLPYLAKKWEAEANGMEDEFMQYFLEQHKYSNKKSARQETIGKEAGLIEREKKIVVARNKNNNQPPRQTYSKKVYQSTRYNEVNVNCTNPDPSPNEIPCPPDDLPQKCDKYNKGDFASCFARCNISFCCIHDSKMELYKSCSKDINCHHYAPCYIIWWKLQDTIGPMVIRTEQSDDFFNLPLEDIKDTLSDRGDVPFFNQIFLHHFDDDGFISDDRAFDPDYW